MSMTRQQTGHSATVLAALTLAFALFILPPACLVLLADPCHVFHKALPGIFHHGFNDNQRCQNAGLVNQYLADDTEGYDAALMGTSLSGSFIGADIANAYQLQRALKLFLPDGKPAEQQVTMERALLTRPLKLVIWEILPQQYLRYRNVTRAALKDSTIFPAYLYNNSRLDDYRYVFNLGILGQAISVLQQADYVNIPSIDSMGLWDHGCPTARRCKPFHTAEDIAELRKTFQAPAHALLDGTGIAALDYRAVDERLLETLLPYCNIAMRVDLFFPPLSYLWFAEQAAPELHYHLYMLRYVTGKVAHCHNMRVFAFNDEQWIAGDLAHYRDLRHFYGDVQHYLIESMAAGRHRITLDNVAGYEQRFIDAVNHYQPWASTQEQMQRNARY